MDSQAIVHQVLVELEAASKPGRAEFEKRYLKSDLEFVGAPVPAQAKIAKALWRSVKGCSPEELWDLVDAMWATRVHELRGVALDLLSLAPSLLARRDVPRLRRWVIESNGWAHVDMIATSVLPEVIASDPSVSDDMDTWAHVSGLTLREGAKYLPAAMRQQLGLPK